MPNPVDVVELTHTPAPQAPARQQDEQKCNDDNGMGEGEGEGPYQINHRRCDAVQCW